MADRIMFIIDVEDEENGRKWKELCEEHPGWSQGNGGDPAGKMILLPDLTYKCAEQIDKWLKEKGIKRTWLKDNEPAYYRILRKNNWPC